MSRFSFEDAMSRSELYAYVVDWLAHSLSKARILVNGEMCARCEKYGPGTCARCWEEAAWAAAAKEAKRREEMPENCATFDSAGLPHEGW